MEQYVKYAAIALFVIAAHQGYLAVQSFFGKTETCECEHLPSRSFLLNFIIYSLFIAPLLLGFFMPDKIMGSTVAAIKGMNLNSSAALNQTANKKAAPDPTLSSTPSVSPLQESKQSPPNQTVPDNTAASEDAKLQELFKADKYSEDFAKLGMNLYKKDLIQVQDEGFMEVLSSVDMFMDNFIGKKMEISGFVYHEDNMKPNQFVVARLAMQCCSADASPYGVMVESSMAQSLSKDTWVKITGTIGKTTYNDNEIMKLDAIKIEKIQAPKTPYVYPDYEYFEKLKP
jgi:uncharacterized repeat protein (TIGR03943 family)